MVSCHGNAFRISGFFTRRIHHHIFVIVVPNKLLNKRSSYPGIETPGSSRDGKVICGFDTRNKRLPIWFRLYRWHLQNKVVCIPQFVFFGVTMEGDITACCSRVVSVHGHWFGHICAGYQRRGMNKMCSQSVVHEIYANVLFHLQRYSNGRCHLIRGW